MKQIPPVNQYEIEKEFHEFISRPEHRGFNAEFARQLGHKDNAHVSRMHSPFVPEVPSWIYKAALKFDAAARVSDEVASFGLTILQAVIDRHNPHASVKTGRIEFPSKLAFSVTETEINTLELERIPLSHRLSAISELQRQLESYKNGLMMIDCEDSGGENGQQRGGRETQPRSVRPATTVRS